jgi:macrodomain Ter protein organizer (MatP/YcbG family)
MADQKYIIRQQDKNTAVNFIDDQIASKSYWLTVDDTQRLSAEREYRDAKHDSITLNKWCQKWLNETQWVQLKNVISIERNRIESQKHKSPLKVISITHTAWQILSELAKHDDITISEVIINRLGSSRLDSYNGAELGNYSNNSNQS